MLKTNTNYNLESRTEKFSEDIVELIRKIKKDIVTTPILSQLVRSATSIGANYWEANGACSKKILRTKYIFVRKRQKKQSIG